MPASPFEAAVRARKPFVVVDLGGDLSGPAGPALQAVYDEAVATGGKQLLLNFARVGYINSTGIALIVGLLARARSSGVTVVASDLDDHYREIFTITRLSDFMALFPTEDAAVARHGTAV